MILYQGIRGPEVGNWQRMLADLTGITDANGQELEIDEYFGWKTAYATKNFQLSEGLKPDGIVGPLTRNAGLKKGFIPFVQAKHFTEVVKRSLDLIVVHTMEFPEKPTAAEDIAAWFASEKSPRASAHFCVDPNSVVQSVRVRDVAWHAPGANHNGIGIEHAGYARQTEQEWQDETSKSILEQSAKLSARICRDHGIPLLKLTAEGLKQPGARGFIGHVDATNAFSKGVGHWDPGEGFPWSEYLTMVGNYMRR